MLVNEIECEQGMAKVIKNTKKQNDIKLLSNLMQIVNRELSEIDFETERQRCELGLSKVTFIKINCENMIRPAAFHFDAIEACVASNIQNGFLSEIVRSGVTELAPFHIGIIVDAVV